MEGERLGDVDVAYAVAIGETERLFAFQVIFHAFEAPAGQGGLAGVHQGDAPRLGVVVVDVHAVVRHVEGDVGHVQEVVGEVFLDDVALVAQADDEFADPVGRVDLHDVPQDRLAADLDHRLGADRGFFTEACAEAAGQDHGFHGGSL